MRVSTRKSRPRVVACDTARRRRGSISDCSRLDVTLFSWTPSVRVEGHDRIVSVRPDVAGHGVVVTLRGNEALLTELLTTGDWTRVGALVQK